MLKKQYTQHLQNYENNMNKGSLKLNKQEIKELNLQNRLDQINMEKLQNKHKKITRSTTNLCFISSYIYLPAVTN